MSSILPKHLAVFGGSLMLGAVVASLAVGLMQDRGAGPGSPARRPSTCWTGRTRGAGPGRSRRSTRSRGSRGAGPDARARGPQEAAARALLGAARGPQPGPPSSRTRPASRGSSRSPSSTAARSRARTAPGLGVDAGPARVRDRDQRVGPADLQDDQDGGTGLNDLATALWRGYGITPPSGLIRPAAAQGPARRGLRGGDPGHLRRDP